MDKIFHVSASENQKRAKVATLTSDKIVCKPKTITQGDEGHYVMIKESINQKVITIINIYASDIREAKYIKQILTDLNEGRDNNTI